MKAHWTEPFGFDIRWWRSLTRKQRLYVIYFGVSFMTVCLLAEAPVWTLGISLLNFWNSARLLNRVPTDKLEG